MLMSLVVASFRIKSFGESYFIRRFIFLKVFARHSVVIIISIRVIIIILANTELQHSKFYVFIVPRSITLLTSSSCLQSFSSYILPPPSSSTCLLIVVTPAILKHLFICIINKLLWSLISVSFICIYYIYFTGKCIRN